MNPLDFKLGNALAHAWRTGGPKGFFIKFIAAYSVIGIALAALSAIVQWPVYQVYMRMFSEGRPFTEYVDDINQATLSTMGFSALLMPLGFLFYIVFETASQRRYMRGEGFSLKLGGDEGRIAVVFLIWIAMFIGWYVGFFVLLMAIVLLGSLIGLAGGSAAGIIIGIFAVIGMLAGLFILLWGMARLSPASALTIRDKQIRFFEAWRITRKKSGTIILSMILLYIGVLLIAGIIFGPAVFWAFSQLAPLASAPGGATSEAIGAVVTKPGFYGRLLAAYLIYMPFAALYIHVLGGPAALAAKTDTKWSGRAGVSEEFS